MKKAVRCFVWFGLFAAIMTQPGFAQSGSVRLKSEVEKAFKRALTDYVGKRYDSAMSEFESLANSEQAHHRLTAALLMTGKSKYKIGKYTQALPYYERLIDSFPRSRYHDDALYARAAANYRLGKSMSATRDWLGLLDNSQEATLRSKSTQLATQFMRTELSISELRRLARTSKGASGAAFVTLELAQQLLASGATDDAIASLRDYQKRFGSNDKVNKLLGSARTWASRPIKVGVLLPLSGYYGDEGKSVLRGIRFAHNQAADGSAASLQLVVRDSESSLISALHSVNNLLHRENVRAIIGELESDVTASIGALASVEGVPVVAPAASENGVASVGRAVFQLNSDLERKGAALAHYAIAELGMQTFATLAPVDEYGQQMVDSFTSTVDQLGGRIIGQSWYYGTPEDLSRQFKNIRDAAFHHDSTDVDALILEAKEEGDRLDENDIPVLSVDGFFIPVYAEDLKYVAPQLAVHNIRTQVLGGEFLDDLETLTHQQVERYINGAIFVSDYFPNEADLEFRDFRTSFRISMKKSPERWEIFGYDAYQILHDAAGQGARSGRDFSSALSRISGYSGKKGLISFQDNNRVNREVNILQFINGRIVKHHTTTEQE